MQSKIKISPLENSSTLSQESDITSSNDSIVFKPKIRAFQEYGCVPTTNKRSLIFSAVLTFIAFYLIFLSYKLLLLSKENKKLRLKSKGVAICSIAKNENLYLKEFVDHHKKLGVDKIFIYDNNDINGEKLDDVLSKDIKTEYVKVINIRGKGNTPQQKAYADCYKKNKEDFSWILFMDIDEQLFIENDMTLRQLLNDKRFDDCDVVGFNWKIYGDNKLVYYENKTLFERFHGQESYYHSLIKSCVRGGLKQIYFKNPHAPYKGVDTICNTNGHALGGYINSNVTSFYYAYIRHYFSKTAEEYITKLSKSFADIKEGDFGGRIYVRIVAFFEYNEITPEKLEVLKPIILGKLNEYEYRNLYKKIYTLPLGINYINKGEKKCKFVRVKNKNFMWIL